MRGGFAFSISVHALILFLIVVGLPFLRVKPPELPPAITVELVEVGKQPTTNKISPVNKVEKVPKDETPPAPTPPPPTPEPTPEPPKPQEQPREPMDSPAPKLAAVDEAAPPLATPEFEAKRPMPPAPKLAPVDDGIPTLVAPPQANLKKRLAPMPAPQLAELEEPKVAPLQAPAKVDLKRPQPKPPAKSFDSVLKNLSKLEPQESEPEPQRPPAKVASRPTGAQAPLSQQLTASDLAALKDQIRACWFPPASVKDAQNMIIDLDLTISADRTVTSAVPVEQERMSDPVFAAAARAAERAVRSPNCTPLALPPEKYQEWQSMTFRFDPKELLGQ